MSDETTDPAPDEGVAADTTSETAPATDAAEDGGQATEPEGDDGLAGDDEDLDEDTDPATGEVDESSVEHWQGRFEGQRKVNRDLESKLNATRDELDALRIEREQAVTRLTDARKAEIGRLSRLEKPALLWVDGKTPDDFVGEDGRIDRAKVKEHRDSTVSKYGAQLRNAARVDPDIGAPQRTTVDPRELFDAAIEPFMR